jgi:D-glycero-alpha-D-manno-heptose-7-phosphate kinase
MTALTFSARGYDISQRVIISKTPLRVSFVGGGTDLPDFCDEHGGAVVSTAIDKWIHVVVAPRFEGDLRISYSRTETVPTASEVEHELVREALHLTGLPRGLDLVTLADVPSQGTGLGSSSAVTVGLLNALHAYQGVFRSATDLAEEACDIEIEILGKPIGRQDQYASAYGGFNFIEFMPQKGGVRVEPIVCPAHTLERLHRSLMLFYTGRQRAASDILSEQREAIVEGSVTSTLVGMRDLAYELRDTLGRGDVDSVGHLLDRNWELKRSLVVSLSDVQVDEWYQQARQAGASGGKLLGAGAGGFLLIMAPPERQAKVRAALADLREVPFHFAARGSQITLLERGADFP